MWASAQGPRGDGAVPDRPRRQRQCARNRARMAAAGHRRAATAETVRSAASRRCCSPRAKAARPAPPRWSGRMPILKLTDPEGITPLIMSILNAQFDTASVLIKAGANVNSWDIWGRAPLYSAVDYNTTPRGGRPDPTVLGPDHGAGCDRYAAQARRQSQHAAEAVSAVSVVGPGSRRRCHAHHRHHSTDPRGQGRRQRFHPVAAGARRPSPICPIRWVSRR